MYLGIEIGGTKLQLGVGAGDGVLAGLWRGSVDPAAGPDGIRRQITGAVPELLAKANIDRSRLKGVGIGFGGPVDDATRTVIKSHQIEGWDGFPLADWVSGLVGLRAALGNDADVAGLAEALHGAGKGLSPIFYITIGSGIGGGFIIDGEIYRGVGRGAAEIGHLPILELNEPPTVLEAFASGWAMERYTRDILRSNRHVLAESTALVEIAGGEISQITTTHIAQAARQGDAFACERIQQTVFWLALGICQMIALLSPRLVVIGGGVSLMGEKLLFAPLRREVAKRVFKPFADSYDIVPAALGEEVVVHGAIALARRWLQ